MAARKHTHKYHKVAFGDGKVWSCALGSTGCTHYLPPHLSHLVLGRKSICCSCGDEFIIGPVNIEQDEPMCNECSGVDDVLRVAGIKK